MTTVGQPRPNVSGSLFEGIAVWADRVAGLTYEEAAEVCGCALGTIKSRVNRARARLLKLMEAEDAVDTFAGEMRAPEAAGID